eukprot:325927-Prymnesium_polylepis.2
MGPDQDPRDLSQARHGGAVDQLAAGAGLVRYVFFALPKRCATVSPGGGANDRLKTHGIWALEGPGGRTEATVQLHAP